ncbi:MAG: hypothetical protein EOO65_02650, partial [Methanosarcinales archaeon]
MSGTLTPTPTPSSTATSTATDSVSGTPTASCSPSGTPSNTGSATASSSVTPLPSPSASYTSSTSSTPSVSVLSGGGGQEIITTVAGNGSAGNSGDGGPATAAMLVGPTDISALYNASSGGVVLFIADQGNHRIRRVDEGGNITTVAGNGTLGYSGDGGPATAALLRYPFGVAVVCNTTSGGVVLYIADRANHRIRCVDEGGAITTAAGAASSGFSGDGGLATAATLQSPCGVSALINASSGGVVLYLADSGNQRIRRVDEAGIITTVAGTGAAGYFGDGGPATAAALWNPYSLSAVVNESSGGVLLYIADSNNHRIRCVDEGGNITTVAGNGTAGFTGDGSLATTAKIYLPRGVTAMYNASGGGAILHIADFGNHRVRRVNEGGIISTVAGTGEIGYSGDGGNPTAAKMKSPFAVSTMRNPSNGRVVVYIADSGNFRIRRVAVPTPFPSSTPTPTPSASPTGTPTTSPTTSASTSLTSSVTSSVLHTPSSSVSSTRSASSLSSSSSSSPASLSSATSSASGTTSSASVFVTTSASPSLSPTSLPASATSSTTPAPSGTASALPSAGHVRTIVGCITCDGSQAPADGMPAGAAPLLEPHAAVGFVHPGSGGVASLVADAGADSATGTVHHITPGGLLRTVVGPHTSAGTTHPVVEEVHPRAMAAVFHHRRADGSSGNGNSTVTDVSMWIADATRHVVWRLSSVLNGAGDSTNGSIHVAAGTLNMGGYSGDGLPAVNATLNGTC